MCNDKIWRTSEDYNVRQLTRDLGGKSPRVKRKELMSCTRKAQTRRESSLHGVCWVIEKNKVGKFSFFFSTMSYVWVSLFVIQDEKWHPLTSWRLQITVSSGSIANSRDDEVEILKWIQIVAVLFRNNKDDFFEIWEGNCIPMLRRVDKTFVLLSESYFWTIWHDRHYSRSG